MNLPFFISRRLSSSSQGAFTGRIIKVAIAGVALGFAVIVISIAAVNGFQKEIVNKIKGFNGDIEIRKTGSADNYDYPLFQNSDSLNSLIANLDDVANVNVIAMKPAIIKADDELLGVVFKGVDTSYTSEFFAKNIIEGTLPMERNQVLVSKYMADKLNLSVGDKLRSYFIKKPVRAIAPVVCGIYQTGLDEQDKTLLLGSILDIQRIFAESENQITHLEISLKQGADPEEVRLQLFDILDYSLDCHLISELQPQIFQWLEYLDVNKYIILSLMVFVSGISLITALLILVIERTNMIGILKTLGAANSEIKKIFLYKISYIAFVGILIGNIVGVGLCYIQMKTGFFKLNQETYYIDIVPVELSPGIILIVNLVCFAVCFIALMLPVQMVSKVTPSKSLRFD